MHEKWKEFLKERTFAQETSTGGTLIKDCGRLIEVKTNLPYLFSYQKYPELQIPNTIIP